MLLRGSAAVAAAVVLSLSGAGAVQATVTEDATTTATVVVPLKQLAQDIDDLAASDLCHQVVTTATSLFDGPLDVQCSSSIEVSPPYQATVQASVTVTVCLVGSCTVVPMTLTRTGYEATQPDHHADAGFDPDDPLFTVQPVCVGTFCTDPIPVGGTPYYEFRFFSEGEEATVYTPVGNPTVNVPLVCSGATCNEGRILHIEGLISL